MDPITLLGIIGSMASIVTLIRNEGREPTPRQVVEQVIAESAQTVTDGGLQSRVDIRSKVSEEELEGWAIIVVRISDIDQTFLQRISERCLEKYRKSLSDHTLDELEVDEEWQTARLCVCQNIELARRHHQGQYPSEEFRELARRFRCLGG